MAEKPAPRERVAVEVDPDVWVEEVERFDPRSEVREAAEAEREVLEREGIERQELMLCEDHGSDGTRLRGCLKVYVPLGGAAPSERPYGFVLSPERRGEELYLELLAFGRRPDDGSRLRQRGRAAGAAREVPGSARVAAQQTVACRGRSPDVRLVPPTATLKASCLTSLDPP